jgi:hypothetical protein
MRRSIRALLMRRHLIPLASLVLTVITICSSVQCGSTAQSESRFQPVATIDQLMDGIVAPASEALFDAVVYSNGRVEHAPATEDDWLRLQTQALVVAEAGNLLVMPSRAKDEGNWLTLSRAMTDEAVNVARAAEAKDVERVLQTGSALYRTCVACHRQYLQADD